MSDVFVGHAEGSNPIFLAQPKDRDGTTEEGVLFR